MKLFFKYPLVLIFSFFTIVYALISLVNHYNFRTYALDLGLYTNALYDYLHLQWNDSSVFKEVPENLLADHFDLYLIFFAPFSLLFGTYTLLVIQIIFIIVGAYGIYLYFQSRFNAANSRVSYWLMLSFLLFFGIYSALSFDYHSNVVASMLVPYLFINIREEKWKSAFWILFFICIGKENMSLWMCFVLMGLMWEYKNNTKALKHLSLMFLFSMGYFILVTKYVMPYFSNDGKFLQFHYSILGNNFSSAIKTVLTHPIDILKVLFINHINEPRGEFVKLETHIFVLLSGLWALFFKPHYILMLLPIYFQKMFHDDYQKWSIDAHYSIEFAPILIIGAGEWIMQLKQKKLQFYFAVILVILNLSCTIRLMDRTIMFTNKSRYRIYQISHYQRDFDIKNVYKALEIIPENSIVSAQTSILPHLALRDKIYTFPIIKDAEYVIVNMNDDAFPLDSINLKIKVNEIMSDSNWQKIYDHYPVFVFKRNISKR
ncbi:MAG: hypothetical protein KatS3mg027_2085 [Bacteroidia bacterium]|nr:MAG: hypothetical protein KatS3mg027_2085 [Bacteroidia bacterium]